MQINSTVKKYLYNLKGYQDECINDILLGIWNNIESFDENIDELDIPSTENVFEEVTKNELNKEIDKLLNNLNEKDKTLFLKIFVQEQEVGVVSKEMNLHKSNIYNRVSRGKMKLRKLFIK